MSDDTGINGNPLYLISKKQIDYMLSENIKLYEKRQREKKGYEEEQRYYKIEEVCNIIKKSRSSVLTLIKERVLSARKTGRIWLIPKKSLDDYLNANAILSKREIEIKKGISNIFI